MNSWQEAGFWRKVNVRKCPKCGAANVIPSSKCQCSFSRPLTDEERANHIATMHSEKCRHCGDAPAKARAARA
jgi:hypothetical protein